MNMITAPGRFKNHPQFKRWVRENNLGLARTMVADDDTLSKWKVEYYTLSADGKRFLMRDSKGELLFDADNNVIVATHWDQDVRTTPAERRWLDK